MNRSAYTICFIMEATGGGTRRHLLDLVGGLREQGYCLAVICSLRRNPDFAEDAAWMREQGVRVEIVDMCRNINPGKDISAFLKMIRLLRSIRPRIVHTHSAKAGILGRAAAFLSRVPRIVHTPHVFPFEMQRGAVTRNLYLLIERIAAMLTTDRIICVAEREKQTALRARIANTEKITVIENGIDPDRLLPPSSPERLKDLRKELELPDDWTVIGCMGRLCRQKGQDRLLYAAADVVAQCICTGFVFAGAGELKNDLEALAQRIGVADHCRFVAPSKHPEELHHLFDIFALPSRWEGLPYVLLESMGVGNAVVASAVGGVTDVIENGKNGVLVPDGDTQALTENLCRLLRDRAERNTLGQNARQTVLEQYTRTNMVSKHSALYDHLA